MEPERCFYNRLSFPPCKTVPGPLTAIKLLFHRCHGALAFHCACVKFLAGTQLHHLLPCFFTVASKVTFIQFFQVKLCQRGTAWKLMQGFSR